MSQPEPVNDIPAEQAKDGRGLLFRLGLSFFLFGLINNVLYVVVLSAALDLVPPSTPMGIIAFCNIAPSLVAKIGWPYLLKGQIRYAKRIIGCCAAGVTGMLVVAAFNNLTMRLLGICLASFASGLGEITFLQLSTTYRLQSVCGHAVGYFSSGTGAAGIVGAGLWWTLRSLGVRLGVGLSALLPFVAPIAYLWLLPPPANFSSFQDADDWNPPPELTEYTAVPSSDPMDVFPSPSHEGANKVVLSLNDKWDIVQPLLLRFMLPLFSVYAVSGSILIVRAGFTPRQLEYTINQGIAPTLVYPVPTRHPILRHIITSVRDYYPLWQLVYQFFVFFSRSSISIGIPALPIRFLPLPAVVQALILSSLAMESAFGLFGDESVAIPVVFFLIGLEGICGGLAYVNTYLRLGQERPMDGTERSKQEREFAIGSVGFADSFGILIASLIAMPTEIGLCRAQVRRGKMLCATL